jgi:hypothetical protein
MYFIKIPDKTISTNNAILSFFKVRIGELDRIEGNSILENAFGTVMYFNSLSERQKSGVLGKLIEYLKKLKEKLDHIAKDWGAISYTIGVELFNVTLSIDFKPQ